MSMNLLARPRTCDQSFGMFNHTTKTPFAQTETKLQAVDIAQESSEYGPNDLQALSTTHSIHQVRNLNLSKKIISSS